ncbi:aminoglycoside phosphotransferase family protein [Ruegeria arenilitoris]|uniref:aminoglycoside phosphotransferase family protein n=1 Tax=Ruegeria arenilitoris TaxID=1173585 RepID=UPI00147D81AF|nr:aminoglycoside phosphotransferase family protein [Ruegeria arenilitoris]
MTLVPLEFPESWRLTIIEPVADTGLAKVWKAKMPDGTLVALKLYHKTDRGNEAPGARLLARWQNYGAVRIIAEQGKAVLMKWLDGPSLGDIARGGSPGKASELLAEVARSLHAKPQVEPTSLMDLSAVFASLFNCGFSQDCPETLKRDMVRAISIARFLLDTQSGSVPLHGDLHHDNVIQTSDGLRVIDAKGYYGDPAFELANALRHPKGLPHLVRQPEQLNRCVALYSAAMDVQAKRLVQWAAAKCALSIVWRSNGEIVQDPEANLLNQFLRAADQ